MQSAPRADTPHALIHVAYRNGRWRVTESGERNAISNFGERRDAMEYATGLAARLRGSLVIHKRQLDSSDSEAPDTDADDDDPPTARS